MDKKLDLKKFQTSYVTWPATQVMWLASRAPNLPKQYLCDFVCSFGRRHNCTYTVPRIPMPHLPVSCCGPCRLTSHLVVRPTDFYSLTGSRPDFFRRFQPTVDDYVAWMTSSSDFGRTRSCLDFRKPKIPYPIFFLATELNPMGLTAHSEDLIFQFGMVQCIKSHVLYLIFIQ